MAMPRPSGKSLEIAKKVIPNLMVQTSKKPSKQSEILSTVESKQTKQIESRKGEIAFPHK